MSDAPAPNPLTAPLLAAIAALEVRALQALAQQGGGGGGGGGGSGGGAVSS